MAASAIIVGGGSGLRFGLKKQFLALGGIPLLRRTITPFDSHPEVERIIVVVPKDDLLMTQRILNGTAKPLLLAEGGPSRQGSVWNGLMLAQKDDLVLIHDAVRPFVTANLITRVLRGIEGFDACIPGLAITNTLKEVRDGLVARTVPREHVFGVQTPQCFRTDRIVEAHAAAREKGIVDATDDSALIEAMGGKVSLVEGEALNMKITLKQDMEIAEAVLKCRTE